jgi:RNA-directed DNA polymerase
MSLATPDSVQKLQAALHGKAKGEPCYRFYMLYDKVHRPDVLTHAYNCCRANRGAAGMDGQTFEAIEAYGVERWLGELTEDLRTKTYRPEAVRRVWIPKPDGRKRPLGIPTIRDRVAQMAAAMVLAPIFEADLAPEQYAYRPGRGALEAVEHVRALLDEGYREVVDADLSGYFDSIPHAELLKSVARRVVDGAMLHLIKLWLVMPVEEEDDRGRKQRTTTARNTGRGTPQGAPISPLLANIYIRRFVAGWKALGHEARLKARIVNYADDFVLCCRGTGAQALEAMRRMMARLKLTVNEAKTRLCRAPDEPFDFLGYTFGRLWSPRTGHPYIGMRPSKKAVAHLVEALRDRTSLKRTHPTVPAKVRELNRLLTGWATYFSRGTVSRAYRAMDQQARLRLRQWLRAKFPHQGWSWKRYPDSYLHEVLGLVRLQGRPRGFP